VVNPVNILPYLFTLVNFSSKLAQKLVDLGKRPRKQQAIIAAAS